jgi:phosphopantothenoylcysteine decarboxylase/phosphopantothenate--cysteine ligase
MMRPMTLDGRQVVVGVSGGIAAFKAVELVRELGRRGASVRVVMTPSATRFVGPVTFTGITGRPPVIDLWDPAYEGEVHVELASWAHAIVVAPATANVLARAAAGMADDALLATLLCAACPVLYAPAMFHRMWASASTQRNVARLGADGAHFVGPVTGPLANGEIGMGRLADPLVIADALEALVAQGRDLAGRTLVISAGPTHEDLDPVRYLGNKSSGKMGFALAERAAARGARVWLVAGPVALATPAGVDRVDVRSAREMDAAIEARFDEADAIVMSAAVADYRPAAAATDKLKKPDDEADFVLRLVQNPDILAALGARRGSAKRPVLVGFALETQALLANARSKLTKKRADLIVANHAEDGLGTDDNVATLVSAEGDEALGRLDKRALADAILDRVVAQLTPR